MIRLRIIGLTIAKRFNFKPPMTEETNGCLREFESLRIFDRLSVYEGWTYRV